MTSSLRARGLLLTVLCALGPPAFASEEIAKTENLKCTECHSDAKSGDLIDPGHYYQYMRTLDGCESVIERFGRCTYCHLAEPGSMQLTREGHRFRWMMEDMQGLRAWLEENHPRPQETEEADDKAEAPEES